MIPCGKGHEHNNVMEVRECYGVAHLPNVRDDNFIPKGPKQPSGNIAQAKRIEEGRRQAALAREGKPHMFTSKCPACVAGTCQQGAPREPLRLPAPPADEPEPTDKQLRFIGSLLRKHSLIAEKEFIENLTKWRASKLIDLLLNDEAQPLPAGLKRAAQEPEGPDGISTEKPKPDRSPLPDVPEGHYAIPNKTGNNDLDFFRVDRPSEGNHEGKTFIKRVIGGHPDTNIRFSEYRDVLSRILLVGPDRAALLYGQTLGQCSKCNRHLTDDESRKYGMGPDCRSKG